MSETVSIGDVELGVMDRGSGPVILFVHGFPLDHTMWLELTELLAASFRTIVPDLRGFGNSSVTPHRVSMEQYADDLQRLLTALDCRGPVTFCGLSMGGYIAWQFQKRFPELVGSLVLCDTRAAGDSDEIMRARLIMAARVEREGTGFIPAALLPKLFSESTCDRRQDLIENARQVVLRNSPQGIAAAQRGMARRTDVTERLSGIDVPALLLCGVDDVISPPAEMRAMAARMPRAELVEIPDAGHMAPVENPQAVAAALRSFLEQVSGD